MKKTEMCAGLWLGLLAALLSPCAASAFTVDAELPAGNVIVEEVAGDAVRLRPDLRDTAGDWFYWAFRVTGAKGRTLTFTFAGAYGGCVVGVRGPAVTADGGRTWSYPCDGRATERSFSYAFETDGEVRFCSTWQYLPADWEAFLARHAASRGQAFKTGVLCRSRKGADVPFARFGRLGGSPRYRALVTSRHHAGEATATAALEGLAAAFLENDDLGQWLRANVELTAVPFVDYDGVVAGDQGKNRAPHDHNRDYMAFLYPETRALAALAGRTGAATDVWLDLHCPWIRGGLNERVHAPLKRDVNGRNASAARRFDDLLERLQSGALRYRASDDLPYGKGWNADGNYAKGLSSVNWALASLPGLRLGHTLEIPFANAGGAAVTPETCRAFGRDLARALRAFLDLEGLPREVDGIYPHLAMFNREGECGTGAVVPWAGSLWALTYGPHCPTGSSDKLYRIRPDLTQEILPCSVGGTPANRLVHRETNQLLIGPYVVDAKGNVRVVPPARMPGRLTGAARHLTDPSNKVYVATMETGLYELDLRTLAVNTLIRENGKNDWAYGPLMAKAGRWPDGWGAAPVTKVPGYHAKGLASGFGRVFVSNNGEDSDAARANPFVPSGVLADWSVPGRDWRTIRRCQFTEVTTRDGIYGNEHPESDPVWALGWDAKSVILAVTTNGAAWAYYRLPKASHCYDGAHGWNTEWPRIRDVGFGDGTLLATMHGTFWKFPADFCPANPNGIRPLSTYLKVIGDFCRWGDRVVFGCDDQAKSEFLGTRTLKRDAPRRDRSQSNLWFVRPEDLSSFGPPSGEGWVWLREDVKAGDVSDPYLYAGYESMDFTFTDADGRAVPHELLRAGDWVRVKALADARGASARFAYGPARPAQAVEASGSVEVYDDFSKRTYAFPVVNGDRTVVCREVATERDLLYAGGVFYEVPADNAGGFAALRPIALADEPVRTIEARLGLLFVNGRPRALDALWRNGTAAQAYWLWRDWQEAAR